MAKFDIFQIMVQNTSSLTGNHDKHIFRIISANFCFFGPKKALESSWNDKKKTPWRGQGISPLSRDRMGKCLAFGIIV